MKSRIVVALAGNPNSGKTTIFNALTGARQSVGNYPGVTVERKEGLRRHGDTELKIVDLPGTYSLTAYSAEERVARNFIVDEMPDVVVDILDASNLERNLYLAVQFMELGVPLVLAFNMSDMAKAQGYEFDLEKFSRFFGARIVSTMGSKGMGMNELLDAVVLTAANREAENEGTEKRRTPAIHYGREIEEEIAKIEPLVRKHVSLNGKYDARWLALKLLENDREIQSSVVSPEVHTQVEKSTVQIEKMLGEQPETAIAGQRYGFISGVCQEAARSTIEIRHSLSDRIDAVVTNRVLGIPIFLGLMYLVFHLTFTLGEPPMGWIESLFDWLGGAVASWWPEGSESLLKSLLVDGVIGGVGGVVVFLPNILLLFLAIAIIEDSGYMARAAFIMDQLMHKIGLHGKSFIPMLIGFGCSVPAILATRTLDNRRDRLTTMLVIPLMSCGARLPIYALIIPAFFPSAWHGPMLWIIYVIGILLAVAGAKLLRATILKGESVPFVMELPPYRMPTFKSILIHMWERGWLYLKKAGTVILGISILLWALTTFPGLSDDESARFRTARQVVQGENIGEEEKAEKLAVLNNAEKEAALRGSVAGRVGHALEPLLKPMGFDWKIGTALIGAFAAKEVFVAQMGIVYAIGEADEESETLRDKLKSNYSPLVGFCIMLFCLVSAPCMATIAITRRESNSWRWALLQLGGLTLLAYVLTALVFQIGRLLGIGIG
ncbi:ferrous iron transport protein B [Syntrophus gentianae]|uniref:Ferrous iron transport protein B n=1 Tax=Syntrophus gentianae TaxID=43775 RepID=A0A1H8A2Z6_9BACT|nr:ferrous iron transport protein B [Syntrophus gentianae]SEM64284.1 ferrous iron transport protein B [Syntrophus gentianae]